MAIPMAPGSAPDSRAGLGRIVTFYSYKGGTGRTMAMANTAWILASAGLRVLAIDWDLESPGLHRYFHPFLLDKRLRDSPGVIDMLQDFAEATLRPDDDEDTGDWVTEQADIQAYAVSLDWEFPGDGTIDFVPAGRQDEEKGYARKVGTFDWANFFDRLRGGSFLRAVRAAMREHYDYILIDSRTGLSDGAGICTVMLPDMVVNCFTLSTQSIDGALAVAESIRKMRAEDAVRILPVPMRVEDAEQLKLEAGRDFARAAFKPFLRHLAPEAVSTYWGEVEIPYKPFYAYEEILAAFGDRSRQENTLLAAFERLTSVLTDRQVQELPTVDEQERRRWLTEFERHKRVLSSDVVISYASVDRMWAEWVAGELAEANLRAVLHPVDFSTEPEPPEEFGRSLMTAHKALVLLSPEYTSARHASHVWNTIANRDRSDGPPFLISVRLGGARLSVPFADRVPVDLAGLSPEQARDALLAALDEPRTANPIRTGGTQRRKPRFPALPPPVFNVPPRHNSFTGRGPELEELRQRLSANVTAVVPQALYGLGGVGKTQLALEYAHRFAADYDVVWWVAAEQTSMARSALAQLATTLQLPSGDTTDDKVQAVLNALRKGEPHARYLLIFDNADRPEALQPFIPRGAGHVLLTSRDKDWSNYATAVEVGVFDRDESVEYLCRRVHGLGPADADMLAEKLGDLPLAIEQAGAWLAATAMPIARYLDLLDTQMLRVLEENPTSGYPRPAAATWRLSLERLQQQTPVAAKVLELCAFFGPEPIPMSLLESPAFVNLLLPLDPTLRDPLLFSRVIREIGRFALAKIDTANLSLQMHRLVQAVIRLDLSTEDRAENRQHIQKVLAAARPNDTGDPDTWPQFAALWPHIEPARALESDAVEVRQLLIDTVRYLWKRFDHTSSQELAERTLAVWLPKHGTDDQTLQLQLQLANVLRSRAQYNAAFAIDKAVMDAFEDKFGPDHPYTLIAAGGLAADLRSLGEYQLAHQRDEVTLHRWREAVGEDHPRTLMAANNLAYSLRLIGRFQQAGDLDRETLARRRGVLGDLHPYTLFSAGSLGRDLREIGDFTGSRRTLEEALKSYRTILGQDLPDTLRTAKSLAVTLRKLGEFQSAADLTKDTLGRYRKTHQPEHPDLLACEMNLACDQSALGDDDSARAIAEDVLGRYRAALGPDHTFTRACENNLAIFLRKLGRHERALAMAEQLVAQFRQDLGPLHPYTLACVTNLGNDLFAVGETDRAMRLEEENYRAFCEVLGNSHPDTLAAGSNLVVTRRAAGQRDRAAELFERLVERTDTARPQLGENNPNIAATRAGERLNCDIEPPPT